MAVNLVAGPEAAVNAATAADQVSPAVAAMADGGFVVTWVTRATAGGAVVARRFDAAGGASTGDLGVFSSSVGLVKDPSVSALATGGFVVGWNHDFLTGYTGTTFAQRYSGANAKVGFDTPISRNTIFEQASSQVGAWGAGYVVIWESNNAQPPTANGYGIHGQVVTAGGTPTPNDFRVNLTLLLDQLDPDLAMAPPGDAGYVIGFETPDASGYGVVGRRFDGVGTGAAEFQLNTTQAGEQRDPAVAILTGGGIVAVWTSTGQDGSGAGVFGQVFTGAGVKVGAEFRVNTTVFGDQGHPQVAALADGGFAVVWDSVGQDGSGSGVFLQRFAATGAAVGPETLVNTVVAGDQDSPDIASLPGGVVVTWTSNGQDGSGEGVFAKVFTLVDDTPFIDGGAGPDTIIGGPGYDPVRGLDGDDSIDGGGGNDDLNGNVGADTVRGGDGADTVRGGRDNDLVFGDAGDDPHVNGNIGFDIVRGGDGRDTVYGGRDNDTLYGEAGDDRLSGDLDNDILFGGTGADRFAFNRGLGADWVGDFNAAEGDRIELPTGVGYVVTAYQGQTMLDLGGAVLGLVGVSGFNAAWVVFV